MKGVVSLLSSKRELLMYNIADSSCWCSKSEFRRRVRFFLAAVWSLVYQLPGWIHDSDFSCISCKEARTFNY